MKRKIMVLLTILVVMLVQIVSASDICIDKSAPNAPANLAVTDSPYDADGDVTLSWSASSDEPDCGSVDHYNVYRSLDGSNFEKIGETSVASYNDYNLTQGEKYYYMVTAVDSVAIMPHESTGSNLASTTIGTKSSSSSSSSGSSGSGSSSSGSSSGSGLTYIKPKTNETVEEIGTEEAVVAVESTDEGSQDEPVVETEIVDPQEEPTTEEGGNGITGLVVGNDGKITKTGMFVSLGLLVLLLFVIFKKKGKVVEA